MANSTRTDVNNAIAITIASTRAQFLNQYHGVAEAAASRSRMVTAINTQRIADKQEDAYYTEWQNNLYAMYIENRQNEIAAMQAFVAATMPATVSKGGIIAKIMSLLAL